jgi:hypothetical protein
MLRRVDWWKLTNTSEVLTAFIIRAMYQFVPLHGASPRRQPAIFIAVTVITCNIGIDGPQCRSGREAKRKIPATYRESNCIQLVATHYADCADPTWGFMQTALRDL